MQVLWTDNQQRECAARFTIEAEARNFIALLRTRHGAQDIQLLDEDGMALEASLPSPGREAVHARSSR